jgi:hypothetical protein
MGSPAHSRTGTDHAQHRDRTSHPIRSRNRHSPTTCSGRTKLLHRRVRGGATVFAASFSQVGSGGDDGCGRCVPTGKMDEDGWSLRRFSPKGESIGRPFAVLGGKLASGQGVWRVPRVGARSGHRTCCWARPGQSSVGNDEVKRVASGSRGPRLVGWIGCPALDRVGDVPASTCPPGKVQ